MKPPLTGRLLLLETGTVEAVEAEVVAVKSIVAAVVADLHAVMADITAVAEGCLRLGSNRTKEEANGE